MPVIAYILCSEVSTGHLCLQQPAHGRNVILLRHCAFLVSAIVAVLVFMGDVGFKRWRSIWLPLAGLLLTYLLYVEAGWFTRFLS